MVLTFFLYLAAIDRPIVFHRWTNIITYIDTDLVIAGVTIVSKQLDHNRNLPRNAFFKKHNKNHQADREEDTKVFVAFFSFRTQVPSFLPNPPKKNLNDQSDKFFLFSSKLRF